jgi:16S rRNA G966 N2-methylase RsmD
MTTLHWIGKDKVINHHQNVPFRLLDHQYGALPDGTQTTELTGNGNQIIHGDNLEALKALLPQYEGQVKCIYIDPPYNTGNEAGCTTTTSTTPRDHLDAEQKIKLGVTWAQKAGNAFRYFMVYERRVVNGAPKLDDFLNILREI